MRLVDDWKHAWKWFSTQSMILSTAITATWATLPDDMKMSLPAWVVPTVVSFLLLAGVGGRLIDQPNVKATP